MSRISPVCPDLAGGAEGCTPKASSGGFERRHCVRGEVVEGEMVNGLTESAQQDPSSVRRPVVWLDVAREVVELEICAHTSARIPEQGPFDTRVISRGQHPHVAGQRG